MDRDIKILIVDDDCAHREHIKQIIANYRQGFRVIGEADCALIGVRKALDLNPDLLILDIEMPGGDGFDLLECLKKEDILVIFCSAYHQHALRSFRYNVADYLLKPLQLDLLAGALEKAREKICRELARPEEDNAMKLALHSLNETEYIEIDTIVRLEGSGCYTNIFLANGRQLTVSKAIGEYEYLLRKKDFIRVHKSHIINMNHIRKFVKKDGFTVKMTDNYPVPVAVRRKDVFEQKIRTLAI
jgi:two-component system, LytTR family, response regulator